MYEYVYMYVCVYGRVHTWRPEVNMRHLPLLNLELSDSATLAGPQAPGVFLFLPPPVLCATLSQNLN